MATASSTAITNGRLLVADLNQIRERWIAAVTARSDAVVWRVIDLLLKQPVVDSALIQRELSATSANAARALRQLDDLGIITEFTDKKRNRLWQASEVLSALDGFASRAGRRG
jgi:Fic family protein